MSLILLVWPEEVATLTKPEKKMWIYRSGRHFWVIRSDGATKHHFYSKQKIQDLFM